MIHYTTEELREKWSNSKLEGAISSLAAYFGPEGRRLGFQYISVDEQVGNLFHSNAILREKLVDMHVLPDASSAPLFVLKALLELKIFKSRSVPLEIDNRPPETVQPANNLSLSDLLKHGNAIKSYLKEHQHPEKNLSFRNGNLKEILITNFNLVTDQIENQGIIINPKNEVLLAFEAFHKTGIIIENNSFFCVSKTSFAVCCVALGMLICGLAATCVHLKLKIDANEESIKSLAHLYSFCDAGRTNLLMEVSTLKNELGFAAANANVPKQTDCNDRGQRCDACQSELDTCNKFKDQAYWTVQDLSIQNKYFKAEYANCNKKNEIFIEDCNRHLNDKVCRCNSDDEECIHKLYHICQKEVLSLNETNIHLLKRNYILEASLDDTLKAFKIVDEINAILRREAKEGAEKGPLEKCIIFCSIITAIYSITKFLYREITCEEETQWASLEAKKLDLEQQRLEIEIQREQRNNQRIQELEKTIADHKEMISKPKGRVRKAILKTLDWCEIGLRFFITAHGCFSGT